MSRVGLEPQIEEGAMTATMRTRPVAGAPTATIRPLLEQIHAPWLKEVAEMLEPTQHDDAGIWTRWNVIRYLKTTFAQRLARERAALADLPKHLSGSEVTTLWALGELLDLHSEHLHHLVGLCQHGAEFTTVTQKLLETLEHWCHSIEDDLGRVPLSEVPEQSRDLLLQLAHEPTADAA
jgi:hypothetical protein